MQITRDLKEPVLADLQERMVFIGGPRQVGKTTFARTQIAPKGLYLNWDDDQDKSIIRKHQLSIETGTVILDEVHKYARWRTLVKGLYDKMAPDLRILVTGSARLDHFRKGGDSLIGRYHYFRLHPIDLLELAKAPKASDLDLLMTFGGFPAPLAKGDAIFHRRWQKSRQELLIRQDLTDLMRIREISLLELLADLLPTKVGSPLSIKSLHEDLDVSPHTVESWIDLFENLYLCYRIMPFGAPKIRAVKKQKKLYMYDWSSVESTGARFENLVASHLLKFCHYREDVFGDRMELRYIRDVDLREIDFVVLKNRIPLFAVECKSGDKQLSPAIAYYKERTKIPKFYQVHRGKADFGKAESGRSLPFTRFCELELQKTAE